MKIKYPDRTIVESVDYYNTPSPYENFQSHYHDECDKLPELNDNDDKCWRELLKENHITKIVNRHNYLYIYFDTPENMTMFLLRWAK